MSSPAQVSNLGKMQLFICAKGVWKCTAVSLVNGGVPCIGGSALANELIEPAQWFKVMVLDSVTVDCSEHVLSWSVDGGNKDSNEIALDDGNRPVSTSSGQCSSASLQESLNHLLSSCQEASHSLMAAHSDDSTVCTDDLQALFELAEVLHGKKERTHASEEQKMWLQLLHCYILPLITFHSGDFQAVSRAQTDHMQLLSSIDESLEEISLKTFKLKQDVDALFSKLLPHLKNWALQGSFLCTFFSFILSDIEFREHQARAKIQACIRNMDFNEHLNFAESQSFGDKIQKNKVQAEQDLVEMGEVLDVLKNAAISTDEDLEVEGREMQIEYSHFRVDLNHLRNKSATLSSQKVLALSVREAIEQTVLSLVSGHATSGMDVGVQGGHSTDVLQEASRLFQDSSYLTWRDKIQKLLQQQSTPLGQLHDHFYCELHQTLPASGTESQAHSDNLHVAKEQPLDCKSLAPLVKQHCKKVVDHLCGHFNDCSSAFLQRIWLCYERLLFECFSENIISLYQEEQAKYCKHLMTNAIGLSVIDPRHLELGLVNESWLLLFPLRPFTSASLLYQEVVECPDLLTCHRVETESIHSPYLEYFGGVASDLSSLALAISPLDRAQLLTSALRKAMTGVSNLKLRPYLSDHPPTIDTSLMAVNCDEILPVLVLLLLQQSPWLLSILHLNCCLLTDFIAPFLSSGWHGYSLATFSSTLQIIYKL